MRQNFGRAKVENQMWHWWRDTKEGGRELMNNPCGSDYTHPRTPPLVRMRGVTAEGKQPNRTTDGLTSLSRTKSHFVLSSWVSLPIRLQCPVAIFIFLVVSAGRYSSPHFSSLCATSSPGVKLLPPPSRSEGLVQFSGVVRIPFSHYIGSLG